MPLSRGTSIDAARPRLLVAIVEIAIRQLGQHPLRTSLTAIGIVFGVAAVVSMVTLSGSVTVAVERQVFALGANVLLIRPAQGGTRGSVVPAPLFDLSDVDHIGDEIAGVLAVAPQAQATVNAVYEGANRSTVLIGTTPAFFDVEGWPLTAGRYFDDSENKAGKAVCLLGGTVADELFARRDPIGARIRLSGSSCIVIGLLAKRGGAGTVDRDDVVLAPIKLVQTRFWGNRKVRSIEVATDVAYDTASVQHAIGSLLRERRRIPDGASDDFTISDSRQLADTVLATGRLMTNIVGVVAAISLIVGGIGITNVMLVSVTERTREIGIRLAVGATRREVLMQFLIEAMLLSTLGGIAGLLLAALISVALAAVLRVDLLVDARIVGAALAMSSGTGIVFGYWPAHRAAALNPIDALRYE